MHSMPTLGGVTVVLVALIDGRRVGIAYEEHAGRQSAFLADQLNLAYAYTASGQINATGTPSLDTIDLTGMSMQEPLYGGFVDDMWPRLSEILGFRLPWWRPRLRDTRSMLAWTPDSPPVAMPLHPDLPRHLEMAARSLVAANGSPVVAQYLRHFAELPEANTEPHDGPTLINAAQPLTPTAPPMEAPSREDLAASPAPENHTLAAAARTVLYDDDRLACTFTIAGDTQDRFEQALLNMPTVADEDFDGSLLALAARNEEGVAFRRIDGSDGHIGRGEDGSAVVVPPTTVPGLGQPKLFELPGRHHPIVVDTEGRAWPFPITRGITAYQVGYRGAGPQAYSLAVAQMFADPSQPLSHGMQGVDVADARGETFAVSREVAYMAFSDDGIVGDGISAEDALARLRKAAQEQPRS